MTTLPGSRRLTGPQARYVADELRRTGAGDDFALSKTLRKISAGGAHGCVTPNLAPRTRTRLRRMLNEQERRVR